MVDIFDTFHRDKELDGQKICRPSDRVFQENAVNKMRCAALYQMNSKCASLLYGVTNRVCFGCTRDLHEDDVSLIDIGVQTMYYVKGLLMSLTCADILAERPDMTSGRYFNMYGMEIFCDMETDGGGWTVFQRRIDNSTEFNRGWNEYRNGFGQINGGEFWLGLDKLYRILHTTNKQFQLRVDLEDNDGERVYALYNTFDIGTENDNYTLHGGDYSGSAGDSLFSPDGVNLNGRMFSTKDADNDAVDNRNCADVWSGGWWFTDTGCCDAMLNGPYGDFSLYWNSWKSMAEPRKSSMKIKEK